LRNIVFWDIDTQIDFLNPGGKLYVPGAEVIRGNLAYLSQLGSRMGVCLSGSVDAHRPDDPEFDEWPEHCVYGTPGQQKVSETSANNILFVPSVKLSSDQLSDVEEYNGQVIFEKQGIDVSNNPNVKPFLDFVNPDVVVIYGVVTEICVNLAVNFLAGDLRYNTAVVIDAVKELNESIADSCFADWKTLGVEILRTRDAEVYTDRFVER
jgi:nicotinamidase/pyrazinamidase